MIELRDVTVRYGELRPLDTVSLAMTYGSTAISGPSGSGKSTLLRVIAGQQAPDQGEVLIHGTRVAHPSWRTPSDSRVAVIHQDFRLVPFLTVRENLQLAAELRGRRVSHEDCAGALSRVDLEPDMSDRLPASLSGGQQQRVAIARAVMAGADVLLADEPTGSLDAENTLRVASLLCRLGESAQTAIVVATHDPDVAASMNRHLLLASGNLTPVSPVS